MPGWVLTAASVLGCPHGGQATTRAGQSRVLVESSPALVVGDTTTVAGCTFVVGTVASPCTSVRWSAPATRVEADGQPVLLDTSLGLCLNAASAPQGAVVVRSVQRRVSAS